MSFIEKYGRDKTAYSQTNKHYEHATYVVLPYSRPKDAHAEQNCHVHKLGLSHINPVQKQRTEGTQTMLYCIYQKEVGSARITLIALPNMESH